MDLFFLLYFLLCLALASGCHWLVVHCLGVSVLLYTAARVLYTDRFQLTHVDRYYIPNILLCLAFARECHMLDVSDLPTALCFVIAGCALNYKTGAAVYCAGDIFLKTILAEHLHYSHVNLACRHTCPRLLWRPSGPYLYWEFIGPWQYCLSRYLQRTLSIHSCVSMSICSL